MTMTPLLTVPEAALRLSITADTVYALVREQKLACVRLGSGVRPRLRFTVEDIDAYIARQRTGVRDGLVAPPASTDGVPTPRRSLADLPEASRYA